MINLHNITLRRGAKLLLDNCSVKINTGEKVALIGKNGVGKSSLFALFAGKLTEDGGTLDLPNNWQIAEVSQELPQTNLNASEFVLAGDTRLHGLYQKLADIEAGLKQDPNSAKLGMLLAQTHADLADAGAHDALSRAQSLILGLGFANNELTNSVNNFSGGWKMRLQLAQALMCPSDLLLLDEPTNHLDLDALIWLENYLKRYSGTLLVISHDKDFLDAITNVTLHLENAELTRYNGNYSQFEAQLAQKIELQQSAYIKQQAKIAHLQSFVDRFQYKATKAKQAQSRIKQIERMQKITQVLVSTPFSFEFEANLKLPNPMLCLQECDLGYAAENVATNPITNKCVLQNISFNLLQGQRIGILGANGQGKSTLIKSIMQQLPILSGQIVFGKGLKIGYFAQQELDILQPEQTPLQNMMQIIKKIIKNNGEQNNITEQSLRNHLGKFNFTGDMLEQTVGSMSGGEKARLVLAIIVFSKPNLLLLDEPTNHLDLVTRDALALALNNFAGAMLLVSHDRSLLRLTCDQFWLVADGYVSEFNGDLADYQNFVLEKAKGKTCALQDNNSTNSKKHQNNQNNKTSLVVAKTNKLSYKLQRELEQLPQEIDQLEAQITQINAQINQADFFSQTNDVTADILRKLQELELQHAQKMSRWLELEELT